MDRIQCNISWHKRRQLLLCACELLHIVTCMGKILIQNHFNDAFCITNALQLDSVLNIRTGSSDLGFSLMNDRRRDAVVGRRAIE